MWNQQLQNLDAELQKSNLINDIEVPSSKIPSAAHHGHH